LKRYSEAATSFETVEAHGGKTGLEAAIGSAYLMAGDREKATQAFSKLADSHAESGYLYDAAYQMAEADLRSPLALMPAMPFARQTRNPRRSA
jgi:hypothetical protein